MYNQTTEFRLTFSSVREKRPRGWGSMCSQPLLMSSHCCVYQLSARSKLFFQAQSVWCQCTIMTPGGSQLLTVSTRPFCSVTVRWGTGVRSVACGFFWLSGKDWEIVLLRWVTLPSLLCNLFSSLVLLIYQYILPFTYPLSLISDKPQSFFNECVSSVNIFLQTLTGGGVFVWKCICIL